MSAESLPQRLFRKLILARYTDNDTILVLNRGSRSFERVKDIRTMSSFGRAWTHVWYFLVLLGALFFVFITIGLLFIPLAPETSTRSLVTIVVGLVFFNIFLGIQGLAAFSYFRWRITLRMAGKKF